MRLTLIGLVLVGVIAPLPNTWRVAQGDVRVICPMTIGGSFEATTTALSGALTPPATGASALNGSVTVDLRTLDTGISLRNAHLRDKYLEVDKEPGFETATLSEIDLQGFDAGTSEGKGSFSGLLTLHGVKKPVTGTFEVRAHADGLRVKASFPVELPAYGIDKPRYLGIGVKDIVRVEAAFAVTH